MGEVRVFNVDGREQLFPAIRFPLPSTFVEFSADDRTLLAHAGNSAYLLDVRTGKIAGATMSQSHRLEHELQRGRNTGR